ncbi:MAG TPA: YitT family protein [Clostridiales bacterium]|nr:YitT family protein [Clostridiales bacterium]
MKQRDTIIDYIKIVIGTLLTAISLVCFLVPHKIAPGGVSGIGTVIYYLFNIPVGVTMLAINIPLLFLATKKLGGIFGIRTVVATVLLSVFTDFLRLPSLTDSPILATVYGGLLMGIGLGIVLSAKATTGGTDLFAKLIHDSFPVVSMGLILFIIDFMVVFTAAIVFGPDEALYAFICIFITAKMIDLIQEGMKSAKAFFIITDYAEDICDKILSELDRGATILVGKGAYTKANKDVILCVVNRFQIVRLKQIINEIDEDAFVLVSDVREVLGEGF